MKITRNNIKKHTRNIKNITEDEFKELQQEYGKLMESMKSMNSPSLLFIAFIGAAMVISFNWAILHFVGLIVFAYPFYLFAQREGHQEGYFEGYYDNLKKGKGKDTSPSER